MKYIIGAMFGFWVLTLFIGPYFYLSLTALVGVIVGCAKIIYDEIKELKLVLKEQNDVLKELLNRE